VGARGLQGELVAGSPDPVFIQLKTELTRLQTLYRDTDESQQAKPKRKRK
jgi:hypothetical protein